MEVGLIPRDFVLDGDPASLPQKGAELPIFVPCLLRPSGCIDQDAAWYGGRPRPMRHCVKWRPSSPSPKRGWSPPPQFSAHVYCDQTAGWIKMALGMEVGLGPGQIVLNGNPAPHPEKGGRAPPPQIAAHFYCGQTVGCIKMPLRMEVGLGPGDIVLDGDPALPPQKERIRRRIRKKKI